MKMNLQNVVVIGVFVLLALLLFNFFNISGLKGELEVRLTEIKELGGPAKLELISIETDCDECFNIGEIIATLKDSDINITKELTLDSLSQEAKTLIDGYDIRKLPTIILKGEINKTSIQNFKQKDDALIFDGVTPLYVDATSGNIIGKVSTIIISDKNCTVCIDFNSLLQNLKQSNVFISEEKQVDFASTEAKQLINKYVIKKIPALLLSTDIDAYSDIAQNLKQSAEVKDGYYVIESQVPYIEAETGKLRGLVTLTMLTDNSCKECYDVTIHKQILARFGLSIDEEKTVDISSSEGGELVKKYNITKVPIIILGGDAALYESFNAIWQTVGTVEDDGTYVFRELNAMGRGVVYKDLSTNEVVQT